MKQLLLPTALLCLILAACAAARDEHTHTNRDRPDSGTGGKPMPPPNTGGAAGLTTDGWTSGGANPGSAGADSGVTEPGIDCGAVECGHGECETTSGSARCVCDEGYDGTSCDLRNAEYGRRVKVVEGLADPDVVSLPDGSYLLSGTKTGVDLGFWRSTDLTSWQHIATYDPSALDPNHDYCAIWAPDIAFEDGQLVLYFSAYRGPESATHCPWPSGSDVTTFRAVSEGAGPMFGAPELLFQGADPNQAARSRTAAGCPSGGCGLAIRIDAASFEGRLYYVYFNQGNNVASIALNDPTDFRFHTGPAVNALQAYEENINEGPEIFHWANNYYLFFSAGWFDSQYATYYVMADHAAGLVRTAGVHRLTTPVRRSNGALLESHGHNSVVEYRGEPFNFYHLGVFDGGGRLIRRDTYRQRLVIAGDGTLLSQNAVSISWNGLGGGNKYSLDVVLRSGEVIGPCVGAGRIGSSASVTYIGACPDAGDRLVHKSDVAAFRLYASPGSDFQQVGEAAFDGYSDQLQLEIATP